MAIIFVIISSSEDSTKPFLASELLIRSGKSMNHQIDIEIQTPQGIQKSFKETIDPKKVDVLIQVGTTLNPDDNRFFQIRKFETTMESVFNNSDQTIINALNSVHFLKENPIKHFNIVAVTSCPTGIAHTFMSAESLTKAAHDLGYNIKVETQGSVGEQNALTVEEIKEADFVIIAADTKVDLERFIGKKLYQTNTKHAIKDSIGLIQLAIKESKELSSQSTLSLNLNNNNVQNKEPSTAIGENYKHLMTGVSYMIPFVTAGGILIAFAFALGGIYAFDESHKNTLAWALFQIGAKAAFPLMVPILAGYIAYSIANRPGIAPGMIGGMLAINIEAGFLGGILAGFIAGFTVGFLNKLIKLNKNLEGLKPVIILPVLSSLFVGLTIIYLIGAPAASLMNFLTEKLKMLHGGSAILLGLIIGGMMAFDMGGPLNKAAYAFSTGLIASEIYTPMAAAMIAGMTPPLGIALATKLFSNRFSKDEKEAGKSAFVLGFAFVTEGAIPFAARDPLRVIPALMIGSSIAGGTSMLLKAGIKVPHGGVFILPIPNAVINLGSFILALAVGTIVTTILLGILKKPMQK